MVASRGLLWTYGSATTVAIIQVAFTAVTARSLAPSMFGAYASSQALAMLFSYLSLATVGNAVIRRSELDRQLLATAWSMAAGGGLVAATTVVLLAPLWAALWRVQEHVELVVLAAPTVLLLPLSNLAVALLRRRMEYRRAALTELLAAAVGMGGVGVALGISRQAWLLPLAMPVSLLVSGTAACVLAGERPRLGWSGRSARELGRFMAPVSGLYASHYLVTTWPQLLVGRLFGSTALGFLSRGNMLVMMPAAHLAGGLSKVFFPLLTRVREDALSHRRFVTKLLVLVSGVSAVTFGAIAGAAGPLVGLLLGDRWDAVVRLVPVLALGAAINLLLVLSSSVLENALQTPAIWLTQAAILGTAAAISGGLLVVGAVSTVSVLWIFTGAQAAGHAAQLVRLAALGMIEVRPVLSAYAIHGTLGLVAFATLVLGSRITADRPAVMSVAVEAGLLAALIGLLWPVRRWLPVAVTASSLGLRPPRRALAGARG